MDELAQATISDPNWFPLRFDAATEEYRFAFVPPRMHRDLAFLKEVASGPAQMRVFHRSAFRDAGIEAGPLSIILHSGLGGSTLLTRALGEPGVAVPLQEPPILTDVITYGLRTSIGSRDRLLAETTSLLSRPFPGDGVPVCKVSAIGNGLGSTMAGVHRQSRIVCLQTPLEEMLASFASRGVEGRLAARKLLIGIRNSGMTPIPLSDRDLTEQIDSQLAALAWLSVQKIMADTAALLGHGRVRSITSHQLMRDPAGTLAAVAGHLGLDLDVEARISSGIFDRHAKTGEPFDADQRRARMSKTIATYSRVIDPVVEWARKFAEQLHIPWELPSRLLGSAYA